MKEKNIGASVRARLFNLAKANGTDFLPLLIRYATDRLLYRLSKSKVRNKFVLKGSVLFSAWAAQPHRPTKDADLLGFGSSDSEYVKGLFKEVCDIDATEDGLIFDTSSLSIESIRDEQEYEGNRIKVRAELNNATVTVQVDIGYGDIIIPDAEEISLPSLLGMSPAKLLAYPKETVIAEKTEAMVKLGMANSRMKDFYDINWLANHYDFGGSILSKAIAATFERRGNSLPNEIPLALTEDFYHDQIKMRQWQAFLTKLSPEPSVPFYKCGARIIQFLLPPLLGAIKQDFNKNWTADKNWH